MLSTNCAETPSPAGEVEHQPSQSVDAASADPAPSAPDSNVYCTSKYTTACMLGCFIILQFITLLTCIQFITLLVCIHSSSDMHFVLHTASPGTTLFQTPNESRNWAMRLMLGLFDLASEQSAKAWSAENPQGSQSDYYKALQDKLMKYGLSNIPQLRGTSSCTSQQLGAFIS